MVRTQIYLTEGERAKLRVLARRSGRKQSEIIRQALDSFLDGEMAASRVSALRNCRGIWRGRPAEGFQAVRRGGEPGARR